MSLINKMLRDLDSRHAVDGQASLPNEVRSLPEPARPPMVSRRIWLLLALAAVVIAAVQTFAYWSPALRSLPALPRWPWLPEAPRTMAVLKPRTVAVAPAPALATPAGAVAPAPAPAPAPAAPVSAPAVATLPTASRQLASADRVLPLPSLSETLHARKASSENDAGLTINRPLAKAPEVSPQTAPVAEQSASARTTRAADARVVIDKAQSSGDRAEADYRKGVAAYKRGYMAEAATQFRAALHEDPHHLAARQTLLAMLVGQKQWDDAEVLLKEGLQLMPTQTAWAMALARIEVERGDLAAAWGTLQQYAASAGNNADYQGFAGVLLARLHQPHEAASHYQAALRMRPREGRWWLGLGLALEADGHAAEAQQAYRRAQTADGLSPEMKAFVLKKLQ